MKIFVTLLQGLWSTCQLFCSSAKTFFIAHIFFKEAVALFHKIGKSDCFRKWFLRLLHSLQSSSQLFCWGFFFRPYCFQKAVVLSHRLEKSECFGEYFLRAVVQSLKEFSAFLLRPFFEKSGWPKLTSCRSESINIGLVVLDNDLFHILGLIPFPNWQQFWWLYVGVQNTFTVQAGPNTPLVEVN